RLLPRCHRLPFYVFYHNIFARCFYTFFIHNFFSKLQNSIRIHVSGTLTAVPETKMPELKQKITWRKGEKTMARKSHGVGRLLTAAAVLGAAAAGTWYYLKKKDGSAEKESGTDDEFDDYDKYEDFDKFEEDL